VKPTELMALLRDVPGVAGSCLVDPAGHVLIRDVPGDIADDLLVSVGRRCQAALMAAGMPLPGSDHVVLRFERLTIFAKRVGANLLVLLGEPGTRTTLVRTATRVSEATLAAVTQPQEIPTHPASAEARPGRRRRRDEVWG